MRNDLFHPPFSNSKTQVVYWNGLQGSSISLAACSLAQECSAPVLLITNDQHAAQERIKELKFFSNAYPTLLFPDWETLPYDHFSPHEDLVSDRLATLYRLRHLKQGIVVASIQTLMQRLIPKVFLEGQTFLLKNGDTLDPKQFREQLTESGYRYSEQVMLHGEFAIRGAVIDLFPMGAHEPYRIELFDETVESIRTFNPETQLSRLKIEEINILPAHEFPSDQEAIARFRSNWRATFSGNPMDSPVYEMISSGEAPQGIEYYLPLFFEKTENFTDYLFESTQIILDEKLAIAAEQFWHEILDRYEQRRYDKTRPLLAPSALYLTVDECLGQLKRFSRVKLDQNESGHIFQTKAAPTLQINHRDKSPLREVQLFLNEYSGRVLFCAESTGRRETLLDLLKQIGIKPENFENWQAFLRSDSNTGITVGEIQEGFILENPSIALITESVLFGKQVTFQQQRKARELDPNTLIRNLTELHIGAPVVHIDHGIGRYRGLQHIKTGDIESEYLTLEYANNDKIYVPVTSLHLISRYTGSDPEHAPLHRLGTKQWDSIKEKANKQIRDIAAELLDLYSRREASQGFAFKAPDVDFLAFRQAFPFEETPDQRQAIDDVIKDMTNKKMMDRLICGDVGFGKTEVAMQAAFLATQSGKQVAVLAPTTLLAAQHYENFKDRCADWPIKIGILSRLQTPKEQKETISGLASGQVDIVVGTHKLLNPEIEYKDLGLLIVDEEHRFGVRQKDKIKSLRTNIDILTLTATPIPRTLNMSLSGTRDLSIIATPPQRRLAVKTFIHESNPTLIREAVLREAMRGGQVYYLHNEVSSIEGTAEKLQKLLPEARIAVAHGQMRERQLEQVMSSFYHQKFNVLVCSTIVESGIDVPTANTIIIDRADKFGLAQLHQLRGRVGRSHHQAYAYLLVPTEKKLNKDAEKRLEAIASLEELGAGFLLATHDLEIRGAGELLGEEQSGQMHAIGFSLYMDLLESAVKSLKEGKEPTTLSTISSPGPEVDLHESALIPESYVGDVHLRLTLYKRLADCKTREAIQALKGELIDRFGLLPEVTQHLFDIAHLKLTLTELGIKKVDLSKSGGYIQFTDKPAIDLEKLVKLIQIAPKQYKLQGADKLKIMIEQADFQEKLETIGSLLNKLSS